MANVSRRQLFTNDIHDNFGFVESPSPPPCNFPFYSIRRRATPDSHVPGIKSIGEGSELKSPSASKEKNVPAEDFPSSIPLSRGNPPSISSPLFYTRPLNYPFREKLPFFQQKKAEKAVTFCFLSKRLKKLPEIAKRLKKLPKIAKKLKKLPKTAKKVFYCYARWHRCWDTCCHWCWNKCCLLEFGGVHTSQDVAIRAEAAYGPMT